MVDLSTREKTSYLIPIHVLTLTFFLSHTVLLFKFILFWTIILIINSGIFSEFSVFRNYQNIFSSCSEAKDTQPAFTCSNVTIETLKQGVKYF